MAAATIVYDERCGFCARSVAWIKARDAAGRFAAVGCRSPVRAERFPAIAEADCLEQMYLVDADGTIRSGGDAAAEILRRLPGWSPLGALLALPGVRRLTRRGYRLVARNRHRLGCASRACDR